MEKVQEEEFWKLIKLFDDLKILEHVVIMGSFAEFLYKDLFNTDFEPNIRTRDVDFFYKNISIPKEKINFIDEIKKLGYIQDKDRLTGVSRFYKEDILEVEFLTRILGDGVDNSYEIRYLGIKSEGLRDINIISDFVREVNKNGFKIYVPEPSVYVIQKLLINKTRKPEFKKEKDIDSVKEILYHIKQNKEHFATLKHIYAFLTDKQRRRADETCEQNDIILL